MCSRVPPCPPGSVGSALQGAPYVDVAYRSYPGKASAAPAQENSTTHQRLSKVPESSPVWADTKHTCCGPAEGCRPYSGDFTASRGSEWAGTGAQAATDGEAGKRDSSRPPRVPRSISHTDLSNPHVSSLLWSWFIVIIIIMSSISYW